jgi:hypothetical protein
MGVIPKIVSATPTAPTTIDVTWRHGGSDEIDLAGWIATGGELLAPLKDPALFRASRVGQYGEAVEWGESGDLAIDAHHLHQIAMEQRRFEKAELAEWQARASLSNREAADFLQVSLSTWNAYKAGTSPVPPTVGMICRAALRDPILLQAHYRPRTIGRPRKSA